MIFINAFRVYEKQQNNIKITHMIFTAVFTFDSMLYIFTDFIYKKIIIYINNPIFTIPT